MADSSGFGSGFDDFLNAQQGTANNQQQQQQPTSSPSAAGGAITGLEANPPATTSDSSGVNQGFLDFLSGQEVPSNTGGNGQTVPEVIPPAATTTTPATVAPESNEAQLASSDFPTTIQNTTSSEASDQTAQETPTTTTEEGQQQASSTDATEDGVATETLNEIKQKFGGRWRLVRSDPYDEYLKSTGVGLINRKLASKGTPDQVITIEEDKIRVSINSTFHNQNYVFKLNEETQNAVQKELQSVFCSYKEGKLIVQMTPVNQGFAKVQEVQRTINERGELVEIYTSGENSCRRYFQRVMTVIC